MQVYILHSKVLSRYYVGFSKSVDKRLIQHRKEKRHWTARVADWTLVWEKPVENSSDARQLEKQIKARGAKRFLEEAGIVPPSALAELNDFWKRRASSRLLRDKVRTCRAKARSDHWLHSFSNRRLVITASGRYIYPFIFQKGLFHV